eukprot:m.137892 g.137892  ORF g.137892 m.137892 type:complete len:241 (+) comp17010_c0_seq1:541-1263(+)
MPFLKAGWTQEPEANKYLDPLFRNGCVRQWGLLQRPLISAGKHEPDVYTVKLFVAGKAACGKTSTVASLCGQNVSSTYVDTPCAAVSTTYWPAKLADTGKVVLFRLNIWDAGESACKRFGHLLEAATDEASVLLFVFSLADQSSLESLPDTLRKTVAEATDGNHRKAFVATNVDCSDPQVSSEDISQLSTTHSAPVFRIANTPSHQRPSREAWLQNFGSVLDGLCELAAEALFSAGDSEA